MRLVIFTALIVLGLAVSTFMIFADVPIEATAHNEGDELYFQNSGRPILHVRSPQGVGSATVSVTDNDWKSGFEVRLYLNALEGFVVRAGDEVHRLEVTSQQRTLLEPADSGVLHMNELPANEKDRYFSVRVYPDNFAGPVRELRFDWVDYYR